MARYKNKGLECSIIQELRKAHRLKKFFNKICRLSKFFLVCINLSFLDIVIIKLIKKSIKIKYSTYSTLSHHLFRLFYFLLFIWKINFPLPPENREKRKIKPHVSNSVLTITNAWPHTYFYPFLFSSLPYCLEQIPDISFIHTLVYIWKR